MPKQPEFWSTPPDQPGAWARLLSPAALAFDLGGRVRRAMTRPHRSRAPVICVGNLVVGGAGKTPTTLAICERLAALGVEAHILSRGYGGRNKTVRRVDLRRDSAADVGDEPLVMARRAPVWVGRDRVAAAQAAEAAGAQALVMDDGFQNPSLAQDLSLVVIDAGYGHGNGRVMPAGPLREPLSRGFARAHAAIVIGERPLDRPWPFTPPGLPRLHAHVAATGLALQLRGRPVFAFAGIGRPEKFFETLVEIGADVIETESFPDHYPYSAAILARLDARARELGAVLATTEKDAARFPSWFEGRAVAAPIRLGFEDPEAMDALLEPLAERALEPRLELGAALDEHAG